MGPQPLWNATYTDKLRHDLLLNYDKFARPAQHFNKTTVQLGLEIRHVEFNEFKSMLTAFAWLRLVTIQIILSMHCKREATKIEGNIFHHKIDRIHLIEKTINRKEQRSKRKLMENRFD